MKIAMQNLTEVQVRVRCFVTTVKVRVRARVGREWLIILCHTYQDLNQIIKVRVSVRTMGGRYVI